MRVFSRWMPPRVEPDLFVASHVLACLAGLAAFAVWFAWPRSMLVVASLLVLFTMSYVLASPRPRQLAEQRTGDSICTFARSFDVSTVDPWVLRAVYEELCDLCRCPVRPGDSFERDLGVDAEDLDYAIMDIARRIGRSLESVGDEPAPRLSTVRDLVHFLSHQPTAALTCEIGR